MTRLAEPRDRPPLRSVTRTEGVRTDAMRAALLAFFDAHARDLPWRRTRDPYAIWVSEVMLQQTRVETVIPYFTRFMADFPTVHALADAPLDAVLERWAGLGYYRRARRLHEAARTLGERHGGVVPSDRADLEALPGVGAYTAGAIASIAFGRPEAVVDGNVERVISRAFALEGNPRTADGRRRVWQLAAGFADCARPGAVNQALMELGALVCTPTAPCCPRCPLQAACAARATVTDVERYPERPVRKAVREERWTALVARDESGLHVWLETARAGRWHGMLLPPMLLATPGDAAAQALVARARTTGLVSCGEVTHLLTHASMRVAVFFGRLRARAATRSSGEWVALERIDRRAVPAITTAVLRRAGLAVRAARPAR